MKSFLHLLFAILSLIYIASCASFRSAEGLNGGEVNLSYIAPGSIAVRTGLTDNIETRAMFFLGGLRTDIFLHTKHDSSKANFGITLGSLFAKNNKPDYYTGLTISKKYGRFTPYVSIMLYKYVTGIVGFPVSGDSKNIFKEFSIGGEILIYQSDKSNNKLFFTPEVSYAFITGASYNSFYGAFSIGYTFEMF